MEVCGEFIADPYDNFYKERRHMNSLLVFASVDKLETPSMCINNIQKKNVRIWRYYDDSITFEVEDFFLHVDTKEGTYLIDKMTGTKFISIKYFKSLECV